MSLTPRDKLAAAITRVRDPQKGLAPYFGATLAGFVRRESTETPTLGITKHGVMLWNPQWVSTQSVDRLAAGLMHEVMHFVLHYHDRAKTLGIVSAEDHQLGNLAHDACINEDLRKAKLDVGSDWIFPESLGQPEGLVFEERWRLLKQQQQKGGGKQGQGQPQQSQGLGKGQCGSCAGNPAPGEPSDGGRSEGRSEAEMERIRRQTAEAVRECVAKGRGTVPDSLKRWADEILAPPKVDWRRKLARAVRSAVAAAGAQDLTFGKISRRQAGLGFGVGAPIVPSLRGYKPSVAVIVDTSGSMGEIELSAALSETKGILSAVGAQVDLCVCDAAVHGYKSVRRWDEALAMLKGGGGTDMAPAFEEISKQRKRPEVIVCITDGHIGDPGPEPAYARVIWLLVGRYVNEKPSEWGEVIRVEPEADA